MKVWITGWHRIPGKRVALPSLLAGCLLGCANFAMIDTDGQGGTWPAPLAWKEGTGTADANVPAQVPTAPAMVNADASLIAVKTTATGGRAPRINAQNQISTAKVGDPPMLTSGIRSKPNTLAVAKSTSTPSLPTEAAPAVRTQAAPNAAPALSSASQDSVIEQVEDEPVAESQTQPPFGQAPSASAIALGSSTATPPPFPTAVQAPASAPDEAGRLEIPPPPPAVDKISVTGPSTTASTPPLARDAAKEGTIEEIVDEELTEIVSAEAFDAQLAATEPAPTANKSDEPEGSRTNAPTETVVSSIPLAVETEDVKLTTATTSSTDEEIVELSETDIATLTESTTLPMATESSKLEVANVAKPVLDPAMAEPTTSESADNAGTPVMKTLLELSGLRFCHQIVGFGQTEPLTDTTLTAGQTVLLYVEVANFRMQRANEKFITELASRVIVESASGEVLHQLEFADIHDECETKRTDFFCHYTFTLPESMSPGSYVLRLKVKDVQSGEMAERTMDFAIGTPQLAKGR